MTASLSLGGPEYQQGSTLRDLYGKISADLKYILSQKGAEEKDRWAYDIDNGDLYHVHVSIKSEKVGDFRVKFADLNKKSVTFVYHSKEGGFVKKFSVPLRFVNTKRNIFHYPNGCWEALDDLDSKCISPQSRGLKEVTVYFAKTRKDLEKNSIEKDTIMEVDGYFFAVSDVYPFLR
jgi:hypothetical protein